MTVLKELHTFDNVTLINQQACYTENHGEGTERHGVFKESLRVTPCLLCVTPCPL